MDVILYHLEHEYGRIRAGHESLQGRLHCLRSQDEQPFMVFARVEISVDRKLGMMQGI